jgi:hypothetical protein
MRRASRLLLAALLLGAAGSAPAARLEQDPSAAPTPAPPDPLLEFVPGERLKADSVVALPVDI